MGLATCILFAVIATWITISVWVKWRPKSLAAFFIMGVLSGCLGCMIGVIAGWGDIGKFNLISVFISIIMVVPVAFFVSRFGSAGVPPKPVTKATI